MTKKKTILLTGATGFVGTHLRRQLQHGPFEVRCASRRPEYARRQSPQATWVKLDVNDRQDWNRALRGVDVVFDLVHAMGSGSGYAEREAEAATLLVEAAAAHGVERIVYLGGVQPAGAPSAHLESRRQTGKTLRAGAVAAIELRAGMIIGEGSESWRICRDLSVRLPVMLLPSWLEHVSQPVAIDDVAYALKACATLPLSESAIFDIPGPERLTAKEMLFRIQDLRDTRALTVDIPFVSQKLSSHWLRMVTSADYQVARELVEGLSADLVATEAVLWPLIGHTPMPFDRAVKRALVDHKGSGTANVVEALTTLVGRRFLNRYGRHAEAMGGRPTA